MTNSMFPTEAEYAAALRAVEGVAHQLRYMAVNASAEGGVDCPGGFTRELVDDRFAFNTSNSRADFEFAELTLRGLELLSQGADNYEITYEEICDGVFSTMMNLYKLTMIPKE